MREKGGLNILVKELPTIPYTRVIKLPISAFPATRKSIEDLKIYLLAGKVLSLDRSHVHFRYKHEVEAYRIKSITYRNALISMSVVVFEIMGFQFLIFHAQLMKPKNKLLEVEV